MVWRGALRQGRVMDLSAALVQCGGAARREDLLALGVSESAIRRPKGVWRPFRGVFALPAAPTEVIAARQRRARIGCLSAAVRYGLPVLATPVATHLVVPRDRSASRSPAPPGIVVHRHDLREDWAEPWTTCFETLDIAAGCTAPAWQLAMVDAALHEGRIPVEDLDRLRYGTRARRRWLRRYANARAESPLETLLRVALMLAGFSVSIQVQMRGVGRVDMVVDGALVIEVDGGHHFADRPAMKNDRRRDRVVQLGDYKAFRYVYEDVMYDLAAVVEEVARAVGRQPHRGWEARLAWALRAPSSGAHPDVRQSAGRAA